MIKRYEAIEKTIKELGITKEGNKSFLRIFGELILDYQAKLLLKKFK